MRKTIIAMLVAALAVAALAQETEQQKKTLQALKSHSLGIFSSGTSVRSLLDTLLDDTGLSYVVDPSVAKSESFEFDGSGTMEELLKQVLEPRELDYLIRKDGVIFVSTKKRIEELKHGKKEEKPDLKSGEILFVLKDGTRIKGKVNIEKWNLKTAYGDLTIPSSDIRIIRPGKKEGGSSERDEVETVRFTVAGRLDIDKLEVDTGKGKLTIPASEVDYIVFPRPALRKQLEMKPTGEWLDSGISVSKGNRLEIVAEGEIRFLGNILTPDGSVGRIPGMRRRRYWEGDGFTLMARIGENGKEFKVGSSHSVKAKSSGKLYVRIHIPDEVRDEVEKAEGAYKVKVSVEK
jgi:hypothetical protein